ncbi:sigma-70 family RNA polymerase sigma factor [Actinocrispum sp. NPDC049592]|uniref:sigma-70 family RNA polymerase sigma factor n=1 Tax=Actinocrispum sp. NPDC049592 TaxID=3154835 RepID=UPI0034433BB9
MSPRGDDRVIGHPDEGELERWRSSDATVLRADLDRALGRRLGTATTDAEARRRATRPPRDSSAAIVRPPDRERDRTATTRWTENATEVIPSDVDLIEAVRGGDLEAYGKLYARHVASARNLARQLSRSPIEADDLVSEAFAKVLSSLRAGGGPETAFRPYLLAALRHTAYDKTKRERKLELAEDVEAVAGAERYTAVPFDDTAEEKLNRSLAATAFSALPDRWQTVLWHTEIEGEPPADVAPLLGLTSNGVSALAYRAREGLRKAYLQAHVAHAPSERCRATAARLGAWTREGLSKRETAQVEAHLDKCDNCRALAAELADVNRALRAVVAPLVLGAGTAGYLAATAGKASAAATVAATSATLTPPLLSAAASTVALTVAIVTGLGGPATPAGPSAIARPPASSVQGTSTAPVGQTSSSAASSVPSGSVAPSAGTSVAPPGAGGGPSAGAPPGTPGTSSAPNGAPALTPNAPSAFAMTTGGPPTDLPITISNTGTGPAPAPTLTLSLPDNIKVVGPGNNLAGPPLLVLNAAPRTVGCPAGKGTVTCSSGQQLAPGESVTFVFRLHAGPKSEGGTLTATSGALRITIPVTVTPKK